MRFLISGGGTAGHIYPALTVAERLSEGGRDEVVFAGTPDGLEASIVPAAGVRFVPLRARGFDRARPLTLLTASVILGLSTLKAVALILRERPDAVAGFGGYVSIPVGLAAALTRTPLALHEQNSVPGLANRLLSRWAVLMGVTYPGSARFLRHPDRVRVTGNPVRRAVLDARRGDARAASGYTGDDLVLLVFGGSRGARHINDVTINLYPRLRDVPGLRLVHVAGRIEAASVRERLGESASTESYDVRDYIEDMGTALAAADVVVARAGATSIAEITALGKSAVLVPYPYATDDHQTLNARAVADAGAGILVADADLDTPAFGDAVISLLADREKRERMSAASAALGRRDAAEAVAALLRETAERGRKKRTEDV